MTPRTSTPRRTKPAPAPTRRLPPASLFAKPPSKKPAKKPADVAQALAAGALDTALTSLRARPAGPIDLAPLIAAAADATCAASSSSKSVDAARVQKLLADIGHAVGAGVATPNPTRGIALLRQLAAALAIRVHAPA